MQHDRDVSLDAPLIAGDSRRITELLAEADECDLIGRLAGDEQKRRRFRRLAKEHRETAELLDTGHKARCMGKTDSGD